MGVIIPRFNSASISKLLADQVAGIEDRIIRVFEKMGMEAVNEAVATGSYIDRTGNLRNSAAYVVARDGEVVSEFHKNEFGRDFALEILQESGETGIVLVVVSGMKYAVYVEAKGYIVLTSAEKLAEKRLPILLKQMAEHGNDN